MARKYLIFIPKVRVFALRFLGAFPNKSQFLDLSEATLEEWEIKCELQQQRENEMKKQKTKGKDKKDKENMELPKPMEPQKSIADIIADREGLVFRSKKNDVNVGKQIIFFFFLRLQRSKSEDGRRK